MHTYPAYFVGWICRGQPGRLIWQVMHFCSICRASYGGYCMIWLLPNLHCSACVVGWFLWYCGAAPLLHPCQHLSRCISPAKSCAEQLRHVVSKQRRAEEQQVNNKDVKACMPSNNMRIDYLAVVYFTIYSHEHSWLGASLLWSVKYL